LVEYFSMIIGVFPSVLGRRNIYIDTWKIDNSK
jgi:hypothetical protein